MRRFVEGIDRGQATLSPECLEDSIDADNPVRGHWEICSFSLAARQRPENVHKSLQRPQVTHHCRNEL
jgi:hypothetical protein